MDLGLKDKTALVLGAGGGLGGGIARALTAEGARVALADRDIEAARRAADTIVSAGGVAAPFAVDLGNAQDRAALVGQVQAAFGAVDVLINNSGGPPPTPASGVAPAEWSRHFEAMVVALIDITDRVLPAMRARRWGRIVTSTSSGVIAPIPNLALSNALRLSLLGWSKTLAREVAPDGVTVNVVVPGRIATARTRQLDVAKAQREGKDAAAIEQASAATIPAGRYGSVEEYAAAVTFLAGTPASYITGSVLRVDGGLIASL